MSDHDILLELLEAKNRLERQRKIELIVAIVLILALAAGLFFAGEGAREALADAGIEDPGQAIRDLYDNTENVRNLFDEMKKAGFDNPAQVLQDLREASERLNELFDRISKAGMQGVEQGVEQGREAFEDARDWLAALFG